MISFISFVIDKSLLFKIRLQPLFIYLFKNNPCTVDRLSIGIHLASMYTNRTVLPLGTQITSMPFWYHIAIIFRWFHVYRSILPRIYFLLPCTVPGSVHQTSLFIFVLSLLLQLQGYRENKRTSGEINNKEIQNRYCEMRYRIVSMQLTATCVHKV